MFQHCFYSINVTNIPYFVSNLIVYILKCEQCPWTINDIPSSLRVKIVFIIGTWITCWAWPARDRTWYVIAISVRALILMERHDGITLQWTVPIESTNLPVFTFLQVISICGISSVLKWLKTHVVRNWWIRQFSYVFMLLHWFYPIHYIYISNFVSNLTLYILKFVKYLWTNNSFFPPHQVDQTYQLVVIPAIQGQSRVGCGKCCGHLGVGWLNLWRHFLI